MVRLVTSTDKVQPKTVKSSSAITFSDNYNHHLCSQVIHTSLEISQLRDISKWPLTKLVLYLSHNVIQTFKVNRDP